MRIRFGFQAIERSETAIDRQVEHAANASLVLRVVGREICEESSTGPLWNRFSKKRCDAPQRPDGASFTARAFQDSCCDLPVMMNLVARFLMWGRRNAQWIDRVG